jgi:predicted DNA-binding protein (MmcQ/YjbR family)
MCYRGFELDLKELREYCCNKKGVSEDFPFDLETLVFKVGSKMFALTNIKSEDKRINLKCDPILAEQLRARFESVIPGYHMNKKHWNTVYLDGDVPEDDIKVMIDHSYELVFKGLKKKEKDEILGKT